MILRHGEQALRHAAKTIFDGGVIAFRTDTFYGLGADPLNQLAVTRIRDLKGREENKPILLLISDENQVPRFIAQQTSDFVSASKHFWPGPLTIVGKARKELLDELTAGSGTIGVRLPDDTELRRLVRSCGGALTATSANPSGKLPALTAAHVEDYFPDGIDLIIDAGEVVATGPSTVLDVTGFEPRIIREGLLTTKQLEEALSRRLRVATPESL